MQLALIAEAKRIRALARSVDRTREEFQVAVGQRDLDGALECLARSEELRGQA